MVSKPNYPHPMYMYIYTNMRVALYVQMRSLQYMSKSDLCTNVRAAKHIYIYKYTSYTDGDICADVRVAIYVQMRG